MRPATLLLLLAACGLPEDLLVIQGAVSGLDGGNPEGQPLTLYRDLGATELGCTIFSPWKDVSVARDGTVRITALRQETQGRFGLPRCLRLEWRDGSQTASLSWFGRPRSTQLPTLLTWFDAPGVIPEAQSDGGGVTSPAPSFEVSDARGIIFRQPLIADPFALLAGVGPAPAMDSTVVVRRTQHVQQAQDDALGQDPLAVFEYRVQTTIGLADGNAALIERLHGASCNVHVGTSETCALTDGMFEPVEVFGEPSLDFVLSTAVTVHTVVVRGIGADKAFTAVELDDGSDSWTAGRASIDSQLDLLATGTLEDERQVSYVVVHWVGTPLPVAQLHVRLRSGANDTVAIAWAAEVSVY